MYWLFVFCSSYIYPFCIKYHKNCCVELLFSLYVVRLNHRCNHCLFTKYNKKNNFHIKSSRLQVFCFYRHSWMSLWCQFIVRVLIRLSVINYTIFIIYDTDKYHLLKLFLYVFIFQIGWEFLYSCSNHSNVFVASVERFSWKRKVFFSKYMKNYSFLFLNIFGYTIEQQSHCQSGNLSLSDKKQIALLMCLIY